MRRRFANRSCSAGVSVAVGLALASCSGGGSGGTQVEPMPDLAMQAEPDLAPDYPPGPYGAEAGNVLPEFTLSGYFSPTKITGLAKDEVFGPITLRQLHHSGARFALLQLAAFW